MFSGITREQNGMRLFCFEEKNARQSLRDYLANAKYIHLSPPINLKKRLLFRNAKVLISQRLVLLRGQVSRGVGEDPATYAPRFHSLFSIR